MNDEDFIRRLEESRARYERRIKRIRQVERAIDTLVHLICVVSLIGFAIYIYLFACTLAQASPFRHPVHIVNYSKKLSEQEAILQTNRALHVVTRRMRDKWKVKSYREDTIDDTLGIRETLILNLPSKPALTVLFIDSRSHSYGIAPVCSSSGFVAGVGLADDLIHGDSATNFIRATLAHEIGHNLGMKHNKQLSLMAPFWIDFHTARKSSGRWRVLRNDIKEMCRCERVQSFKKSLTCSK
jgi:hypothetical protein